MKLCRICSCRSWGNKQKGHSENREGARKNKKYEKQTGRSRWRAFCRDSTFWFSCAALDCASDAATSPAQKQCSGKKQHRRSSNGSGSSSSRSRSNCNSCWSWLPFEGCFCVFSLVLPLAFIQLVLNLIKNTCQKVDHYVDFFCQPPAKEIAIKR